MESGFDLLFTSSKAYGSIQNQFGIICHENYLYYSLNSSVFSKHQLNTKGQQIDVLFLSFYTTNQLISNQTKYVWLTFPILFLYFCGGNDFYFFLYQYLFVRFFTHPKCLTRSSGRYQCLMKDVKKFELGRCILILSSKPFSSSMLTSIVKLDNLGLTLHSRLFSVPGLIFKLVTLFAK